MVALRLIDAQHFAPLGWIREVGISRRGLPFRDHALVIERSRLRDGEIRRAGDRLARISVELPEPGTRRIVVAGMKSQTEEAALPDARDETSGDIEKRGREQGVVLDEADQAVLLINEEAAVADRVRSLGAVSPLAICCNSTRIGARENARQQWSR